jgi:hypothetical protein
VQRHNEGLWHGDVKKTILPQSPLPNYPSATAIGPHPAYKSSQAPANRERPVGVHLSQERVWNMGAISAIMPGASICNLLCYDAAVAIHMTLLYQFFPARGYVG